MPFKSEAQRRKFRQMVASGEISQATYDLWDRETGDTRLPERVEKKKTASLSDDEVVQGSQEAAQHLSSVAKREIARIKALGLPVQPNTEHASFLTMPGRISDVDLVIPHDGELEHIQKKLEAGGVPFRRMHGSNAVHSYTTPDGVWVDVGVRPRKEVDYIQRGLQNLLTLTPEQKRQMLLEKYKMHASGDPAAYKKWKQDFYEKYNIVPPGGDWSKVAVVQKQVKDYRRAVQALSGGTSFHATKPEHLEKILRDGAINPGKVNYFSPPGVDEVYFGTNGPSHTSSDRRSGPLFGVPTQEILDGKILQKEYLPEPEIGLDGRQVRPRIVDVSKELNRKTFNPITHWTITPNAVPLQPKHLLVGQPTEDSKRLRLRTIPRDAFDRAMQRVYGDSSDRFKTSAIINPACQHAWVNGVCRKCGLHREEHLASTRGQRTPVQKNSYYALGRKDALTKLSVFIEAMTAARRRNPPRMARVAGRNLDEFRKNIAKYDQKAPNFANQMRASADAMDKVLAPLTPQDRQDLPITAGPGQVSSAGASRVRGKLIGGIQLGDSAPEIAAHEAGHVLDLSSSNLSGALAPFKSKITGEVAASRNAQKAIPLSDAPTLPAALGTYQQGEAPEELALSGILTTAPQAYKTYGRYGEAVLPNNLRDETPERRAAITAAHKKNDSTVDQIRGAYEAVGRRYSVKPNTDQVAFFDANPEMWKHLSPDAQAKMRTAAMTVRARERRRNDREQFMAALNGEYMNPFLNGRLLEDESAVNKLRDTAKQLSTSADQLGPGGSQLAQKFIEDQIAAARQDPLQGERAFRDSVRRLGVTDHPAIQQILSRFKQP